MKSSEKTSSKLDKQSSDEILQGRKDLEDSKIAQTKTKTNKLVKKESKDSVAMELVDEEHMKDKTQIKPEESENVRLLYILP